MQTFNRSQPTARKSSPRPRSITITLAAATILIAPGSATFAHTPGEANSSETPQYSVTANDARRIARKYLGALGYSTQTGPGGARIRSISRDGNTWIIDTRLGGLASAITRRHLVYVNAHTGVIGDRAEEVAVAAADTP